jgi:hypothetical protein
MILEFIKRIRVIRRIGNLKFCHKICVDNNWQKKKENILADEKHPLLLLGIFFIKLPKLKEPHFGIINEK